MTTNFEKLDKFEKHDFRRWQKKMHFLLTTLKVVYILTTPIPELLEDDTVEAIRRRANLKIDESIYVSNVIDKLPPFWKDFKHGKDDLSLVQLGSHLSIEESLRAHDSDKGKKRGFNENNDGSGSNKKPKLECWKCGKTGHFKRDCRSGKKITTQMLVVRERGLRTNPKNKVDAIM
ncbi:zinc finger, CCHC-type containing protein [Tanacetum coccineum]